MALGWPESPEWLLVSGQPTVFSQDGSANNITVSITTGWKILSCSSSLAFLSHTWPLVSVLFLATTVMLSKGQSGHDTSLYKMLRSLPATTRIKSEFLPMATGPCILWLWKSLNSFPSTLHAAGQPHGLFGYLKSRANSYLKPSH